MTQNGTVADTRKVACVPTGPKKSSELRRHDTRGPGPIRASQNICHLQASPLSHRPSDGPSDHVDVLFPTLSRLLFSTGLRAHRTARRFGWPSGAGPGPTILCTRLYDTIRASVDGNEWGSACQSEPFLELSRSIQFATRPVWGNTLDGEWPVSVSLSFVISIFFPVSFFFLFDTPLLHYHGGYRRQQQRQRPRLCHLVAPLLVRAP